jgi:predicted nucleotidyltransferase
MTFGLLRKKFLMNTKCFKEILLRGEIKVAIFGSYAEGALRTNDFSFLFYQ